MKTKIIDDTTEASSPGWLRVSPRKLYMMHPELASWRAWMAMEGYIELLSCLGPEPPDPSQDNKR